MRGWITNSTQVKMSNIEYCSFVGEDSIICECGVNFSDEDSLRSHLELEHNGQLSLAVPSDDQQTSNSQFIFLDSNGLDDIEIKAETDSDDESEDETTYQNEQENNENVLVKEEEYVIKDEMENNKIITKNKENYVKSVERPAFIVTSSPSSRVIVRQDLIAKHQVILANSLEEHTYDKEVKLEPIQDFVCELCGKSFNSNRALKLHSKRHYPKLVDSDGNFIKPIKGDVMCDVCGKAFKSNAALGYHNRVHTGEKPFKCTYCGKGFSMPLFLTIHTRIHTGERPYPCRQCEKKFSSRAALNRHERVHTGEKPYSCEVCGKSFSQSNSMKLHIHTVHLKLPSPYKSHTRMARQQKRMEKMYQLAGVRPKPKINVAVKIPGLIRTTVPMDPGSLEKLEGLYYSDED